MPDDQKNPELNQTDIPSTDSSGQLDTVQTTVNSEIPPNQNVIDTIADRTELISRARSFLTSPQIQNQDLISKRRFLTEKGLTDSEVENLLREVPQPRPHVPPPTYPQPPPSKLPDLLIGIARVFSWLVGGSAVLILLYHRILLPRLTRSLHARQSLKSHHTALLRKLRTSIVALKESQTESFTVLPRPQPEPEDPKFADCHSIDDIISANGGEIEDPEGPLFSCDDVPEISLLRCAIEEYAAKSEGKNATTEELFQLMESKIPWLTSDDGVEYENSLWKTLSTSPLFTHAESPSSTPSSSVWSYIAPNPPSPTPLGVALTSLRAALPSTTPHTQLAPSQAQRTLQALSEFTGYITTQTYSLPSVRAGGGVVPSGLSPIEDEVRKEIRALKGLVLNRRNFMPTTPRPSSTPLRPPTVVTP